MITNSREIAITPGTTPLRHRPFHHSGPTPISLVLACQVPNSIAKSRTENRTQNGTEIQF